MSSFQKPAPNSNERSPQSAKNTAPADDTSQASLAQERLAPVLDFYAERVRILAQQETHALPLAAGAEGLSRMPLAGDRILAGPNASGDFRIGSGDARLPASHGLYMQQRAQGIVPIVVGVYGPGPDPGRKGDEVLQALEYPQRGLTERDQQMLSTFAARCCDEFGEHPGNSSRTDDKVRRAAEIMSAVRITGRAMGYDIGYETPVKSIQFSYTASLPGKDGSVIVLWGWQ